MSPTIIIHTIREWEVLRGVIAFVALGGITRVAEPNRLWSLAQAHGWTLEEFVDEALCLFDGHASKSVAHIIHQEEHQKSGIPCVCPLSVEITTLERTL